MTLQQKAYSKIDQLSDDEIKFFINIIDIVSSQGFSVSKSQDQKSRRDISAISSDIIDTVDLEKLKSMTKAEKKRFFLQSAGKMKIDSEAIKELRERSKI